MRPAHFSPRGCAVPLRLLILLALVAASLAGAAPAAAEAPAHASFLHTWERTDKPVASGQAVRTWMWGPGASTGLLVEPYAEAPGGRRTVQYFDKSRMEITQPQADPASIWYVGNGLLVVELITGRLQLGDNTFEQHAPAQVNVAGDPDDPDGPTYAGLSGLLGAPAFPEGSTLGRQVFRDGSTTDNTGLESYGVLAAHFVAETGHSVAAPFWEFMNATGTVYEGGSYGMAALFVNPFYATGYPVTEGYWASVRIGGTPHTVLVQCFERRCLTWAPDNPPEWRVEAGNVGLHYFTWRYTQLGNVPLPALPPVTGDVRIAEILYDPPGNEGQEEWVDIANHDVTAIDLTGWRLTDSGGITYTFPPFVLQLGATVRVHACAGVDDSATLYTGRCSATWNNGGDTAYLYDVAGRLVSTYAY